ncbi:Prolipoprotein diacylglyceryl transferase [Candidatus Fokinia solitaria]|uniref:Phosphatidylglycerol--prolipoprotein diacylglyceryl transferase n=1 Tax=Candidatus Fokinia solitaria TaxID=1802984 RepID=A0A2U8BSU3_9RICK|nr:prolipoprotein diacylglyceryl transferase [Candidatus Fokinia solitaria]AWD33368.1 Prolipoprotein diacylglyceryl transferase [Candidatus Fokinia solitaria]
MINNLDPIAFHVLGFDIYWYGIFYGFSFLICSLMMGYFLNLEVIEAEQTSFNNKHSISILNGKYGDRLLIFLVLSVILGSRLGYTVFYAPHWFQKDILHIFNTRNGGLSLHGGLIGGFIGILLFSLYVLSNSKYRYYKVILRHRNNKFISDICCSKSLLASLLLTFSISDAIAIFCPIGLLLGRISNFINGELYGTVTELPIGIIFAKVDSFPRHPSQIYEAILEGIVLLFITTNLAKNTKILSFHGMISGITLVFYSIFRYLCEFLRAPLDGHVEFMNRFITKGQSLSVYSLCVGGGVILFSMLLKFLTRYSKK